MHQQDMKDTCAELEQKRAKSATLLELAQFAQGGARNISLPLFVVIRRFREVVEAANAHLGTMLGGRLLLEPHSEQVDRRTRYGLGLRVVDSLSGTVRDTKSVSGGEAFCCSLALALGLAEVVLLESGGLRADTLFVDEGFGSLDQRTLQFVIDELDELRDGGRMVGVVSHVSEMREQIHRQIQVSRSDEGPSVVTVSGT